LGDSADIQPYAVRREIDDLEAVIDASGIGPDIEHQALYPKTDATAGRPPPSPTTKSRHYEGWPGTAMTTGGLGLRQRLRTL
jgi:hypothetical protein